MTMFSNKHPLQLRSSTQIPKQIESRLTDGYLILSVSIKEAEVGNIIIRALSRENPSLGFATR